MASIVRLYAFTKWVNHLLEKAGFETVDELVDELRDGIKLLELLQAISDAKLPRERGRLRAHAVANVSSVLRFITDRLSVDNSDNGDASPTPRAEDVADGDESAVLRLLWLCVLLHWKLFADSHDLPDDGKMPLQQMLVRWCLLALKQYDDVRVRNLHSDWRDCMAFCAIVHHFRPTAFDLESVATFEPSDRCRCVLETAAGQWDVPQLLHPDEYTRADQPTDAYATTLYLYSLYQVLPRAHVLPLDELPVDLNDELVDPIPDKDENVQEPVAVDVVQRRPLAKLDPQATAVVKANRHRRVSETMKEYQVDLEDVLAWLLSADEHMSSLPPVSDTDLSQVKSQFKQHEEFMERLAGSQQSVGSVLQRGQALARSGRLTDAAAATARRQVAAVHDRWERLRTSAMQRQAQLHDRLMLLQQHRLDAVCDWLTEAERHIEQAAALDVDAQLMRELAAQHRTFQERIEEEQAAVSELRSFVAVVDGDNVDSIATDDTDEPPGAMTAADLQQQLQSIGARWMRVCQWAERRAIRLDGLADTIDAWNVRCGDMRKWLDHHEAMLATLKGSHHLDTQQQVDEQVQLIKSLYNELVAETDHFVGVSRCATELINRLDNAESGTVACDIRRAFDLLAERWNVAAAKVHDNAELLLRSGKVTVDDFLVQIASAQPSRAKSLETAVPPQSPPGAGVPAKRARAAVVFELDQFNAVYDRVAAALSRLEAKAGLLQQLEGGDEGDNVDDHYRQALAQMWHELDSRCDSIGREMMSAHETGRAAVEASHDQEECREIEARLHAINERWRSLRLTVENKNDARKAALVRADFESRFKRLAARTTELCRWAESFGESEVSGDATSIRSALAKCGWRLVEIKDVGEQLEQLEAVVDRLEELGEQHDFVERCQSRLRDVTDDLFVIQILSGPQTAGASLLDRIVSSLRDSLGSQSESSPVTAASSLAEWLDATDELVQVAARQDDVELGRAESTECETGGPWEDADDVFECKLATLRELEALHQAHSDSLGALAPAGNEKDTEYELVGVLPTNTMSDLREHWRSSGTKIRQAIDALLARRRQRDELNERLSGWKSQLAAATAANALAAATLDKSGADFGVDDCDSTRDLLQKCGVDLKKLLDEIKKALQNDLSNAENIFWKKQADKLVVRIEQVKSESTDLADRVNAIWDELRDQQKFVDIGRELDAQEKLVGELHTAIPSATLDDSIEKLRVSSEIVSKLKEMAEASDAARWSPVVDRCGSVCGKANARIEQLGVAKEHYTKLLEGMNAERRAFDRLEKMGTPEKVAEDAEEYSEHLDDVERVLADLENEPESATVAAALQSCVVQPPSQYEEHLRKRNEILAKCRGRRSDLERSVHECQEFEESLVKCRSWLTHVDAILRARLEHDFAASDVPMEYKDFNARLVDLSTEFDYLKSNGERLITEGTIEEAAELRQQLTEMTAQLSSAAKIVESNSSTLEESESVMTQLTAERNVITNFLDESGTKLAEWEAGEPAPNVADDVKLIEEHQNDVSRHAAHWAQAEALTQRWDKLVGRCSAAAAQAAASNDMLHRRWDGFSARLSKWKECLLNMNKDDESLQLEFDALAHKVSMFIVDTEKALDQAADYDRAHLDNLLKDIRDGMSSTADGPLEQLRDKAVELCNRTKTKATAGDRVQPLLAQGKQSDLERMESPVLKTESSDTHEKRLQRSLAVHEPTPEGVLVEKSVLEDTHVGEKIEEGVQAAKCDNPVIAELIESARKRELSSSRMSVALALDELEAEIGQLGDSVESLNQSLDAGASSLSHWIDASAERQTQLVSARELHERLVERGRRVAEKGPSELEVQNALDKIDLLCSSFAAAESRVEADLDKLKETSAQHDELLRCVEPLRQWIDDLDSRQIRSAADYQALQRELRSRQPELDELAAAERHVRAQLPPVPAGNGNGDVQRKPSVVQSAPASPVAALFRAKQKLERKLRGSRSPPSTKGTADSTDTQPPVDEISKRPIELTLRLTPENLRETSPTASVQTKPDVSTAVPLRRTASGSEIVPQRTVSPTAAMHSPGDVSMQQRQLSAPVSPTLSGAAADDATATLAGVQLAVDTAKTVRQLEESLKQVEMGLTDDSVHTGYGNFEQQESTLRQLGESLTVATEVISRLGDTLADTSTMGGGAAAQRDRDRLKLMLQSVGDHVARLQAVRAQRDNALQQRLDSWHAFHRHLEDVDQFMTRTEQALCQAEGAMTGDALEQSQLDLEAELNRTAVLYEQTQADASHILNSLSPTDAMMLRDGLETIGRRWQTVCSALQDRRERLEARLAADTDLKEELSELQFWCDETEALLSCGVDLANKPSLLDLTNRLKEHSKLLADKRAQLGRIEKEKERYLRLRLVPVAAKHQIRRDAADLTSRLAKIKMELDTRNANLAERLEKCDQFWKLLNSLSKWARERKQFMEEFQSAKIYTPTRLDPNELVRELSERQADAVSLSELYEEMVSRARGETESGKLSADVQRLYDATQDDLDTVQQMSAAIRMDASDVQEGVAPPTGRGDATSAPATRSGERLPPIGVSLGATEVIEEEPNEGDDNMPIEDMVKNWASRHVDYDTSTPLEAQGAGRNTGGGGGAAPRLTRTPTERMVEAAERLVAGGRDAEQARMDTLMRIHSMYPQISAKGAEQMQALVAHKHWLSDSRWEHDRPIDLCDVVAMKDASKALANLLEELQTRKMKIVRIMENAREPDVQHKAELLSHEWERATHAVTRRKRQLALMISDSRDWDLVRSQLELWLHEGRRHTVDASKVADMSLDDINAEVAMVSTFFASLPEHREKMTDLNERANKLLDKYPQDDATRLSHTTSELNTQWSKFNDSVRIRRAVLEASARSRQDTATALGEFGTWLRTLGEGVAQLLADTDNQQLVKEPQRRRRWMEQEKALRVELDAHCDVLKSLNHMAGRLAESMDEAGGERRAVSDQLADINAKWADVTRQLDAARDRLEAAQEQWERLTANLNQLISWTDDQDKAIMQQQPVGGDLSHVTEQMHFVKKLMADMEQKEPTVQETIKLTHSFLMQQDLRTPYTKPEAAMLRVNRRLAHQIKSECDSLQMKWKYLRDKTEKWASVVEDSVHKFETYDASVQRCDVALLRAETSRKSWRPVKDVLLEELPSEMAAAKTFKHRLAQVRAAVDEVNDRCARLLADNVQLSPQAARVLDSLNQRYKALETASEQRCTAVSNALTDFGPSSQHFLMASVAPPWERAVNAGTRVPYFINHDTTKTQWDHPKMTELLARLCEFNDVKFAAYRTGMKLRALQKRLFMDLMDLSELAKVWERRAVGAAGPEGAIDVSELVMALLPVYERVQTAHPDLLKSLPQAVDLCLNFVLNVYDPSRIGAVRVLSVKVLFTLLCCADIQDKYKYLFSQVANSSGGVDQKKLALLLWDCVQLPRYLGEVAAFGGTNVEPSVRSCFQRVKYPHEVTQEQFLDWVRQEPQSLVWLPVLHRVAASESTKHQAKCNVCKMFPIIGLRYRCLKCFNFDICQSCFFSQRVAKQHKVTHPMKEYCIATSSGEDVTDFSKVVRNKFMPGRSRTAQIGYLPLRSVDEGAPLEARHSTPHNDSTELVHSRLEALANRLHQADPALASTASSPLCRRPQSAAATGAGGTEDQHATTTGGTLSSASMLQLHSGTKQSSASNASLPPKPPSRVAGRPTENGVATSPAPPVSPMMMGTAAPVQSPAQIVRQIDNMHKEELDNILKQKEAEHQELTAEYDRLRTALLGGGTAEQRAASMQAATSTPHLANGTTGRPPPTRAVASYGQSSSAAPYHRSMGSIASAAVHPRPSAPPAYYGQAPSHLDGSNVPPPQQMLSEEDLLAEARALRLHKVRLEQRARVLEDHNKQLAAQMHRIQRLVEEQGMGSPTVHMNGFYSGAPQTHGSSAPPPAAGFHVMSPQPGEDSGQDSSAPGDRVNRRMECLMSTAADLGRAVGSLVTATVEDDDEVINNGDDHR